MLLTQEIHFKKLKNNKNTWKPLQHLRQFLTNEQLTELKSNIPTKKKK